MALADNERARAQIDVLLAEYQACHSNRNHYDSVRWIIGSIFIATSLTLFGFSFFEEVRESFWEVTLIATLSLFLMVIWHGYNQHVNPYVMASIIRLHQIEQELSNMNFHVRLHRLIRARTHESIRGAWITYFLLVGVTWMWIFRMWFFFQEEGARTLIIALLVCLLSALVIYGIHMGRLNARDIRNEIDD